MPTSCHMTIVSITYITKSNQSSAPAQTAVARPQNGDKKMNVFGAKNEIHILKIGYIICTEVILSLAIFCCCDYFILAKNIHFPPFWGGLDFLVLLRQVAVAQLTYEDNMICPGAQFLVN